MSWSPMQQQAWANSLAVKQGTKRVSAAVHLVEFYFVAKALSDVLNSQLTFPNLNVNMF